MSTFTHASSFLGTCAILAGLGMVHGFAKESAQLDPEAPVAIAGLLEEYCHRCHGPDEQKGEFRIDGYAKTGQVIRDRREWLKVLEQLETREMPTKNPLPTEEEYEAMISWVDGVVNGIDWEAIKHPGHVTIPRLTKREYNRTTADLLGLSIEPGRDFSEDGEGKSGFTNDRDGLFITPSQMEKYFDAAERAIDSVMSLNEEPVQLHFESEDMFMTESGSRPQPFLGEGEGYVLNRGQMTLYDSIEIPSDGLYRFTIRARSTTNGPTGGKLRLNDAESGEFIVPDSKPGDFEILAFVPEGSHQMAWNIKTFGQARSAAKIKKPEAYPELPEDASQIISEESKNRAPLVPRNGTEQPPLLGMLNRYDSAEIGVQRAYEWLRLYGPEGDPRQLERFHGYVLDRMKAVDAIRPVLLKELHEAEAVFEKRFGQANKESLKDREALLAMAESRIVIKPGSLSIDWIEIEGPLGGDNEIAAATAAWFREDSAMATDPEERKATLSGFATKAFRRPVDAEDLGPFLVVYDGAIERGENHGEALKQSMAAILVSPRFLFRIEQGPTSDGEGEGEGEGKGEADEAFPLGDWELASRLSYFLWLTMPDDRLFELAETGTLSDPGVLAREVDRMLDDEKADAFLATFAGQWLGYELLGLSVIPDEQRFPEFTPELARSMKAETRLWFGEVFRGNRPLTDLIDANETFLDTTLARHYEITGVRSERLKRVALDDRRRGGILGMASVLTATSTPVRTSPVLRGVWVMEKILGEDPGEPLADAGELPGNAGEARGKTLREELVIHRDRAACASCHDKIDPPGFGLEQFDAIGRFREEEAGKPVDASGVMPDGTEFTGVVELKDYLLENRSEAFVRNVARRMLAFGLGRELKVYDEPAVERIMESATADDYRARAVVKAVVQSYPFLNQHPNPELFAESP